MGMTIEDIKHCLKVMVDCEVCEECNLYGTTGTDHCEKDCVDGALHIIDKYQKIQKIMKSKKMNAINIGLLIPKDMACVLHEIQEVVEDGNNN